VILHGLARLPDGRRKQVLRQSWDGLMAELFAGRIWPFTSEAAHWYGELLVRPMASADAVIAAIALIHGVPLATRNEADFADIGLVLLNPWNGT
jgi:toxin FitB